MPRGLARHQIWVSDELRILHKLYEESYRFVIQKVPSSHNRPRGVQDTTCRHSECPNRITPPGSYRASLEKLADCDPANNVISYEAINSLKSVRKTPKGSQGRRGLGANGQEWWCLKCLETLFVHLREDVWKHTPDGSTRFVHPLTSIQYWILPERRTIPQFEVMYYTLQAPQIHLLAKWQAVKTFDELRNRPAEGHFDLPEDPVDGLLTLYLGQDGESFYLDREARDLRGLLSDNRVCEIEVTNVRGYSLSEALRRLDKKENRMVEEKWKPIMAEQNRKVEEGARNSYHTKGQLAKREGDRGHEAKSAAQEESGESMPEGQESKRTRPITYVGNDLLVKSRKRKNCDLDQTENPAKPRTFAPQALTLAGTVEAIDEGAQAHTSFHSSGAKSSQGVPLSPVSPTQPGSIYQTRGDGPSPSRAYGLRTATEIVKGDPRADARRSKPPIALASQLNFAPSVFPAVQASPPLRGRSKASIKTLQQQKG